MEAQKSVARMRARDARENGGLMSWRKGKVVERVEAGLRDMQESEGQRGGLK